MSDEHQIDVNRSGFTSLARQSVQETAKWIVAIAAALGAFLLADIRLADLARLETNDPRLYLALATVLAALGSIAITIRSAARLLTARYLTVRDVVVAVDLGLEKGHAAELGRRLEEESDHLFAGIAADLNDFWKSQRATHRHVASLPHVADRALAADQARARFADSEARIVELANHYRVSVAWDRLMRNLAITVPVVLVGVTVFSFVVSVPVPADERMTLFPDPVAYDVSIVGERTIDSVAEAANCDSPRLDTASVVASAKSGALLVSVPASGDCPSVMVRSSVEDLIITPQSPSG